MRSSSSVPATPDNNFSPRGHDALVRDIEELALQNADLGIEAEGLSRALVEQQVTTVSAINDGIAAHEAKADPHPQYLLVADYSPGATFTGFSAESTTLTIPDLLAYATANFSTAEYDPDGLYSAGVFTAPSTGVYWYSVHADCNVDPGSNGTYILYAGYLMVNGVAVPKVSPGSQGTGYAPLSGSISINIPISMSGAVSLAAGDTMEFQHAYFLDAGSVTSVNGRGRFTVYKIG